MEATSAKAADFRERNRRTVWMLAAVMLVLVAIALATILIEG